MGSKSATEMVVFAATNNEESLRMKPATVNGRGDRTAEKGSWIPEKSPTFGIFYCRNKEMSLMV